jgi:hypothetical protein
MCFQHHNMSAYFTMSGQVNYMVGHMIMLVFTMSVLCTHNTVYYCITCGIFVYLYSLQYTSVAALRHQHDEYAPTDQDMTHLHLPLHSLLSLTSPVTLTFSLLPVPPCCRLTSFALTHNTPRPFFPFPFLLKSGL